MKEDWKSTIQKRIVERNINQSKKYENIMISYNSLVEEKNNLLAIIASLTSENMYLLNNRKLNHSFESTMMTETNISRNEEIFLSNETKKGHNNNNQNDYNNDNSLNYSRTNIMTMKSPDSLSENTITKKEFLEVIKEKGKNEELILLLKNSVNEKEKLLNILNKENNTLNNVICKREEELYEKKKDILKLEELLNKKQTQIKLYENNNKSLKTKVQLHDRKNQKYLKQYNILRFTYFKLLKQVGEMKIYNNNINQNYFSLRKEMVQKKEENQKLLNYLLNCKNSYKKELKKLYKEITKNQTKQKHKYILFKNNQFYVNLYLKKF
ncbi:hypothetical protein PGSY75_1250900 [Plasmodium gaboni]|uniref:Uncharacterized protein n=1 Tax=Plasmodium gaboni TaxID=647221 RepID=A0A151LH46_9APIC|nr:hypothetical protein PGSY75_1250900 [Plasmodium gaboni]KYN98290.1 hypothetical protein PGSY75_1250900 [Plasmodium gaboni]